MRKRFITLTLFIILVTSCFPVVVYAGNDGLAHDNPFGDSGAGISFGGDAKYYDFLLPYNLTFEDIGGYATSVTYDPGCLYSDTSKYGTMTTSAAQAQKRVGQFNVQGSKGSTWLGCSVKVDSNTGFQYVEKDGCQFYIASLPKAVFNYSAAGDFYGFSSLAATGVIYDMILKDGTVIHFATGDGMGIYHTNNDETDQDPYRQDKLVLHFNKLKLPQYKNLYHASSPNHTFEVFIGSGQSSTISRFKSYYGISDSNPIVAIRMWNKSIKAGGLTVNSGYAGLSSKGAAIDGTVIPSTGGVPSGEPGSVPGVSGLTVNPQFVIGSFQELDMQTYSRLVEPNTEERYLNNANAANMSQLDLEGLTDWNRNNENMVQEDGWIARLRQGVVLVGILMTIWALFIYLAFWFDHLNTFFYIDALHIVTFGQLHICQPNEKPTFRLKEKVNGRTVDHMQVVGICLTAILFGVLLMSGVFYKVVDFLVNLVLRWLR